MMFTDYTKDLDEFNELITSEEKSFKPLGTNIGEYARKRKQQSSTDAKGKGKAPVNENGLNGSGSGSGGGKGEWEDCGTDEKDAVVFEAYQVRPFND